MAYDEGLAERIREHFQGHPEVVEKKMFGGLAYMVRGHMCCGILQETLMVRVGPDQYEDCLKEKYAREMDFTGRALKGMVYVEPAGFESVDNLAAWIAKCEDFVLSLPPK